jgi:hypothetical protein
MENDMAAMRRNQGAVILGTISNFLTGTHRVSAVAKILGGATVLAATYVSCGSPGLRSELSDKIELSNRPIESSPADCASPLASGLLRFPKSLAAVEYLDICSAPRQIVDQRISESSPLDERLRVLSERKLHTLITPPGVTFIRDREKVAQI